MIQYTNQKTEIELVDQKPRFEYTLSKESHHNSKLGKLKVRVQGKDSQVQI